MKTFWYTTVSTYPTFSVKRRTKWKQRPPKNTAWITTFDLKKVKCTLVQALRLCTGRTAHRRSRGIALLFLDHGTRRGWGFSVTPRPLFTFGKEPVPIVYTTLGGPPGRSGQVRKILPPPGFDPRTVQSVDVWFIDLQKYLFQPRNYCRNN